MRTTSVGYNQLLYFIYLLYMLFYFITALFSHDAYCPWLQWEHYMNFIFILDSSEGCSTDKIREKSKVYPEQLPLHKFTEHNHEMCPYKVPIHCHDGYNRQIQMCVLYTGQ